MITYPRKCKSCDHIANNPANWHYHKRIHECVPVGQLCDFGCGQSAKFHKSSGKYSCSAITQRCPEYINKQSARVSQQWKDNIWEDRKTLLKERVEKESVIQEQSRISKQIKTKRKKRISMEQSYDRKKYNRAVLYHSNKNYNLNKTKINPSDNLRGKREYHLDHKVSKFVGYMLKIPIDIISSSENLTMIHYIENATKSNKCSMHPISLMEQVGASKEDINRVKQNLHLVKHLIKGEIL